MYFKQPPNPFLFHMGTILVSEQYRYFKKFIQKGDPTVNELAIATVPVQDWEQPLEPEKALRQGTVFSSLYKPFYIEEQMSPAQTIPASDCESLLNAIQQISFMVVDITLYLDTHPKDQEALKAREENRLKRKELLQKFAAQYYPLTPDCEGLWSDGPIPWEGVCEDVVL